jgi:hypothetical protein
MKKTLLKVILPFLVSYGYPASPLEGQTISTWNGGSGTWSDANLWTPAGAPNSAEADVVINKATPAPLVTVDNVFTVGRLAVYPGGLADPDQPLRLGGNGILKIVAGAFPGSGLLNYGCEITSVATGAIATPAFQLSGDVTFSGIGQVTLTNRTISGLTENSSLTIADRQTIRGGGNIGAGSLAITNNGTIDTYFSGVPLIVEPRSGSTMVNNGDMYAVSGRLELSSNAKFTNNSVFYVASGSGSQPASMTVPAGVLTNFSGTTLTGGTYEMFAPQASLPATLSLGGGPITTNDAVVMLNGPASVFAEINALVDNQGAFILKHGRNFTTSGGLTNSGFVGTYLSTMTINGAYDQTATGILDGGTFIAETFAISGNVYMGSEAYTNGAIYFQLLQTGTLTLQGAVTLAPTAVLNYELASPSAVNDRIKVMGDFVLDGTLTVNRFFAKSDFGPGTYVLIEYSGAFTDNGLKPGIMPAGFEYQIDTTSQPGLVLLIVGPSTPPARLLNISTRLRAHGGDNALIGGFILTGDDSKRVIVRALGPSLTAAGLPGALSDTTLELYDSAGKLLASNDNWRETQEAEIQATTLAPSYDSEAAIVTTLPAGNAGYTAIVRGKGDSAGVALVEVYDLDSTATSRLANISTRGVVGTGDDVMIGGFIVGAGGATRVVVRGLGPSLTDVGVAGALQDPTLELVNSDGVILAENNNWITTRSRIQGTGIPPKYDAESAIVAALAPGNYTAIVRGVGNTTGVGLVEVYNLP